jgi:CTP synthase (UTP-ammonia lyase)
MVDWSAIKTEYVTGESSYRELAKDYSVSLRTIADRAKKENWVELRKKHRNNIATKTLRKAEDKQVQRALKLMSATDDLLKKIVEAIEVMNASDMFVDVRLPKQLSSALKDIKDIQGCKTPQELREQEARIKLLEKQVDDDDSNGQEITVVFKGDAERWAK